MAEPEPEPEVDLLKKDPRKWYRWMDAIADRVKAAGAQVESQE